MPSDEASTAAILQRSAAEFFKARADRSRLRRHVGRPRQVDRELWLLVAQLGWTGLLASEEAGGSALGFAEAAALVREAGRHLFAEPLVAAIAMPSVLLSEVPATALTKDLWSSLISGERLHAIAFQEAVTQLDQPAPRCQLVDGRLRGSKRFVWSADMQGVLWVMASDQGQPVWVAVDASCPGVSLSFEAAGLGQQASVYFDEATVIGEGAVLQGGAALRALQRVLDAGRVLAAAELVGLAEGCLSLTLAHVRNRRQFDRALGSFQSVQHRCVDMYVEIQLATASLNRALELVDLDREAAAASVAICAAKARAADAAVRVGRESVQMHGAMGFCDEVDAGLYLRAALHDSAWLGGPVALRRRFAAARKEGSLND